MTLIRRSIRWAFLDSWTPEGVELPRFTLLQRIAMLAMFGLGCGWVAITHPSAISEGQPVALIAVVVGVLVLVADSLSQMRNLDQPLVVVFSHYFAVAAAAHLGAPWELVVAAGAGRALFSVRIMPYGHGVVAALGNAGALMLQVLAVGTAAQWIGEQHGMLLWPVAVTLTTLYAAIDIAYTTMVSAAGGVPPIEVARTLMHHELGQAAFNFCFSMLAIAAVGWSWWSLPALFGFSALSAHALQAREDLMLTEHKLTLDPLTGIANRAALDAELAAACAQADQHGTNIAAILLDVDDFKQLNDSLGHAEGDHALICTARALANTVRACDLAARYGGEEFAIIICDATTEVAEEIAERVRTSCAEALAPWGNTVSVGYHVRDVSGCEPQQLLERADAAMYAAKRNGKNRCAEQLATGDIRFCDDASAARDGHAA